MTPAEELALGGSHCIVKGRPGARTHKVADSRAGLFAGSLMLRAAGPLAQMSPRPAAPLCPTHRRALATVARGGQAWDWGAPGGKCPPRVARAGGEGGGQVVIGWAAVGSSGPRTKESGRRASSGVGAPARPARASVLGEDAPTARPPAEQPGWRARFLGESRPCT